MSSVPKETAANADIHAHRILILDFGSQYTQLIARRVRECGVYSEIYPWDVDEALIRKFAPAGVILSWKLHGDIWALIFAVAAFLAMMTAYAPCLRLYRHGFSRAVLLPAAALCYTAMTVDSARRHWLGRGGIWKSRSHAPNV